MRKLIDEKVQLESTSLAGRFVGVSIIRTKNANQHFLVCKPFLLLPAIKVNKIMSPLKANMTKKSKIGLNCTFYCNPREPCFMTDDLDIN